MNRLPLLCLPPQCILKIRPDNNMHANHKSATKPQSLLQTVQYRTCTYNVTPCEASPQCDEQSLLLVGHQGMV
jgi:hypothetical protein